MNLGRILGVILSIFVAFTLVDKDLSYKESNKVENNPSNLIADNTINNETVSLNDDTNSNVSVSKYTNTYKYPVVISTDSVKITCTGEKKDAELTEKNMLVKANFSKNNDDLTNEITVKPGETINIYVTLEYVGSIYPDNEVTCDYSLNLNVG